MISAVRGENPILMKYLRDHESEYGGLELNSRDSPDFAFLALGQPDATERKDIKDLWASLKDGRLENQLVECSLTYHTVTLLVEGVWTSDVDGETLVLDQEWDGYFPSGAPLGRMKPVMYNDVQALIDRVGCYGVHVRWSASPVETARTLIAMYNSRNVPVAKRGLFQRIVPCLPYHNENPLVQTLMRLRIPGIGAFRAATLAGEFKSVRAIANASRKDLARVVGDKHASAIEEIFGK